MLCLAEVVTRYPPSVHADACALSVTSQHPERVCGLHYFNPVQVMKLVEIVHTDHTSADTLESINEFVAKTGKTPVSCGDTAGFIVNRLLVPYIAQGVAMLARDTHSPFTRTHKHARALSPSLSLSLRSVTADMRSIMVTSLSGTWRRHRRRH